MNDFYPDVSIDEDIVEINQISEQSRVIEENLEEDLGEMQQKINNKETHSIKNLSRLGKFQVGYFSESDNDDGRLTLND